MLYRPHRGGLDASMDLLVTIPPTMEALEAAVREQYEYIGKLNVKWYGFDDRINWDVHMVYDNRGPCGWTDMFPEDYPHDASEGAA